MAVAVAAVAVAIAAVLTARPQRIKPFRSGGSFAAVRCPALERTGRPAPPVSCLCCWLLAAGSWYIQANQPPRRQTCFLSSDSRASYTATSQHTRKRWPFPVRARAACCGVSRWLPTGPAAQGRHGANGSFTPYAPPPPPVPWPYLPKACGLRGFIFDESPHEISESAELSALH
jgi:hypothetical protein